MGDLLLVLNKTIRIGDTRYHIWCSFVVVTDYHIISCHVVSRGRASVSVHKLWRNHGLERWGMHGGRRQLTNSAKAHLTPQSKEKDWEEPHFSAFGGTLNLLIGPGAFPMNSILLYHSWCWGHLRATSHTRLRAHDHYTSGTLIGGKGGPVQIHFALRLRDQRSMWMQDGCKVYMDSYMASNGSCFIVYLDYFQKPPLGGRANTKPGDHDTVNVRNCWFILLYHVWGPYVSFISVQRVKLCS